MDIYGESPKTQNRKDQYKIGQEKSQSEVKDYVVNIDCDKRLTLMDCIQMVKKVIDDVSIDTNVTLYVVKGVAASSSINWKLFWEYLQSTNRHYNIVYRGYITDVDFLMAFDLDFITVYLSESCTEIGMLKHHGYKFELL